MFVRAKFFSLKYTYKITHLITIFLDFEHIVLSFKKEENNTLGYIKTIILFFLKQYFIVLVIPHFLLHENAQTIVRNIFRTVMNFAF